MCGSVVRGVGLGPANRGFNPAATLSKLFTHIASVTKQYKLVPARWPHVHYLEASAGPD